MKAVWTGLRDHKSLCYALFVQAETTVSCLTNIQAIVSRLPSIVERARPEHQGFHDTRNVRRRCRHIWGGRPRLSITLFDHVYETTVSH